MSSTATARGLFKDIARSSGIYLFASVVQRFAGVLMIPVVTRCLTPAEYGMADLIEQTTSVLSILLGLKLSSALGYFYFRSDTASGRHSVASTTILGSLGLGVLAATVSLPFSAPLSQLVFGDSAAARYLQVVLLAFPAGFAAEAMFTWLRVENRPGVYTLLSSLRLGLQMTGILVLVAFLGLGLTGVVYTSLAASMLNAGVLALYCFRTVRPSFDLAVFGRVVKYAAPLGLGAIAMFVAQVGDRFLLPRFTSLGSLGIYVLACKVGMLLSFAFASFQGYWNAQAFAIMRRPDSGTVFARLLTYVVLGIAFAGSALVACAEPAVRIMAAPAFHTAAAMVPLIVVAHGIRCFGEFVRRLFLVEGRPGYDAVCSWVGAGACLVGYLTLIPRYGAWGAVATTATASAITAALAAAWTYRLRPYRVEGVRLAKIGAACGAAALVRFAAHPSSLPAMTGLAALSLAVFLAVLWLLRFPTTEEVQSAVRFLETSVRRLARRAA